MKIVYVQQLFTRGSDTVKFNAKFLDNLIIV